MRKKTTGEKAVTNKEDGKVSKRGRPLGSKNKTRKQTALTQRERLRQMVEDIPVSQARQGQLDEEEDGDGTSDESVTEEENDGGSSQAIGIPSQVDAPSPPPGQPIPLFTVQSWKAAWRRAFFKDWRWARKPPPKDGFVVWGRCKTGKCDKSNPRYYAGELNSFTNFVKHLEAAHPEEYANFLKNDSKPTDPTQPTMESFPQFRVTTKLTKQRQHQLDIDLAFTIAVDNIPFNILCRPRFRHWIHSGMMGYHLPGVERVKSKLIPEAEEITKMAVLKIIHKATSFTIVLDIWSSRNMMGFIGFTIIVVTRDFERHTIFLCVRQMFGKHTADNILAEFEAVIREWGIPRSKILMVKTDGGSNMVANTFTINLPGWVVDEPVIEDEDNSDLASSLLSTPSTSQQDSEPMVEVEISTEEDVGDEMWLLLQDPEVDLSEMSTLDPLDEMDFEEVEAALNLQYPSSESAAYTETRIEEYALTSRLRSDCVAHKLQLVIKDGFKKLDGDAASVLTQVSEIVNFVRKSGHDNSMVFNAVGFRLPARNATRWNSSFYMLAAFLKAIETDPSLQTRLIAVKKHRPLNANQILILKEIVVILKPFESASDDFQADFETVGNVIPAYLALLNMLTLTVKNRQGIEVANPLSKLTPVVKKCKDFVNALRESLIRRFAFILNDAHYVLGSIFDPRFKKGWIKSAGLNDCAVVAAVEEEIKARYSTLLGESANMLQPTSETQQVSVPNTEVFQLDRPSTAQPPASRKRHSSHSLYCDVINATIQPTPVGPNKLIEELKAYLNEPNVPMEVAINPMDPDSDMRPTKPFEFWKMATIRFPLLSEIGRDAVSVAASSGSIERSFSTASDILSAKRSRMKPDLFARLMFIKCNSKLTWIDTFMSKK